MLNNSKRVEDCVSVEVLAERIGNVSKKLDEQAAQQKSAVDAAMTASQTAISAALATQEKAVNAAFLASEKALTAALSASEKAISKAEAAQSEVNKIIAGLQNDVISLRESRSQGDGKDTMVRTPLRVATRNRPISTSAWRFLFFSTFSDSSQSSGS